VFIFERLFIGIYISKKIISTANSATGLGKNNNISLFEGPHTGKNFLTTEMINKIKKRKSKLS
jgi:hypothetical protein